jgi:protein-disulfide isomerase
VDNWTIEPLPFEIDHFTLCAEALEQAREAADEGEVQRAIDLLKTAQHEAGWARLTLMEAERESTERGAGRGRRP